MLKQPDDLKRDGIRLGVDKGTTQETTLRGGYPKARVIAYDDSPLALTALRTGAIQAFAQDGAKLGALLATLPNRSELEISPFVLTREYMGIGVPKGETKLTATIDQILQGLEKDGTAGASMTAGSARRAPPRCRATSSSAAPSELEPAGRLPAPAAALSRLDAGGL